MPATMASGGVRAEYGVAIDMQRLLMVKISGVPDNPSRFTVVFNWPDEIDALSPGETLSVERRVLTETSIGFVCGENKLSAAALGGAPE